MFKCGMLGSLHDHYQTHMKRKKGRNKHGRSKKENKIISEERIIQLANHPQCCRLSAVQYIKPTHDL